MAEVMFVWFLRASGKLGLEGVMLTFLFLAVGVVEDLRDKNNPAVVFVFLAFSSLPIGGYALRYCLD